MNQDSRNKRRTIRFIADPEDYALIMSGVEKSILKNPITALLIDESALGCQLVLPKSVALEVGLVLKVKVGKLDPIWAEVRWVKPLSEKVTSVGMQYLAV